MNKKQLIGIGIFVVLIAVIIGIKVFMDDDKVDLSKLKTVYVATGGGKEDFIADEEVIRILQEKYGLNVVFDSWSNGKTITAPLIREYIGEGNKEIIDRLSNGDKTINIDTDGVSRYDALFTSDQRFYDYYKLPADKSKGEATRHTVLTGGLTLNTPIVIYSWADVTDALVREEIVTEISGIYYITDMNKLLNYILEGKKWADIGLPMLYGNINIASTDPVTSSPGATYYGLLLSIMCNGDVNEESVNANLPKLKEFYDKSGYMNNTPADLFEKYLKTGMGGAPMIVDYEKSIVEFATSNPEGYKQIRDDIRILYPTPTIWNSHCIASFTENGNKYYEVFENPEVQKIAWEKYGFRTGVSAGNYDVTTLNIKGIPQQITSLVTSLKMEKYDKLIEYLSH